MKIKINNNILNKKIKLKRPNVKIKIKHKNPIDYEEELNKIFINEEEINKTEQTLKKNYNRKA